MKLFKRKHFQSLIYSIFLALPLLSVVGRSVYTIANKNAKDSYYGETINNTIKHNEYNNLETYYSIRIGDFGNNYTQPIIFNVSNVKFTGNINQTIADNLNYIDQIYFYRPDNQLVCRINYTNETNATFWYYNSAQYLDTIFSFYLINKPTNNEFENYIWYYTYNNYSYLDNAFEYSIDRFVSENDYGNLDFFSWFSTLFLSCNSLNSLYIHFINWYMNYILYVSLGYLIFSVLLWFVNFFRKLVDNTQNINVGGL